MPGFPPAPDVGFFIRYVLENPYPLTIALALIALALGWLGLTDNRRPLIAIAVICALVAAGVLITGMTVTTSGEHARRITRQFVNAVVANDLNTAMALMTPDASLAVGSPQNPGRDRQFIHGRLADLSQRYPIQSNTITTLRSYSQPNDAAIVHLACRTSAGGYGPTPSQWVLHIHRDADGQWRIRRLTAISIALRRPDPGLW